MLMSGQGEEEVEGGPSASALMSCLACPTRETTQCWSSWEG